MGEESLEYLFVAYQNRPVFSMLVDTEVVSFLWLIDFRLHDVAVAERDPGRGHFMSEVRHCVMNLGCWKRDGREPFYVKKVKLE